MRNLAITWLHRGNHVTNQLLNAARNFPKQYEYVNSLADDEALAAAVVCLLESYNSLPPSSVMWKLGYGKSKYVKDREGRSLLTLFSDRLFELRRGEFADTISKSMEIYLNRGWTLEHATNAAKRYAMKKFLKDYFKLRGEVNGNSSGGKAES